MHISIWNWQRWRFLGFEVIHYSDGLHNSAMAPSSLNMEVIMIVISQLIRIQQDDIPANGWNTRLCTKVHDLPPTISSLVSLKGMYLFLCYPPVVAMINRQTVPDLRDNFVGGTKSP